jgi:hypothetical protein
LLLLDAESCTVSSPLDCGYLVSASRLDAAGGNWDGRHAGCLCVCISTALRCSDLISQCRAR